MKTEIDIERDFYAFIKQSEIGSAIHGDVYRSGMRPANAVTEDAVVKFLAGYDAQIQTGIVLLHIYVPGIVSADGNTQRNATRIGELEKLILDFVRNFDDVDYLLDTDGTPYSTFNEDIEQYLIVARLQYQILSND